MAASDVPIAYDVAGPADAKAILFVHGVRLTRKVWLRQMEALAGDYRVIAVDLLGHGELARTRFALETAVQGIAAVVEREARGRVLLVGSSLGGYVAMQFAHRYPEQTVGLVLSGCSRNIRGAAGLACAFGATFFQRFHGPWLDRVNAIVYRRLFSPSIAEPVIAAGFYFQAAPDALRALIGKDFRALLPAIPHPILFLNGVYDLTFRLGEAAFAAAARDARIQIIRRGSHRCHLEYPDAFTEAVRRFAASIGW